MKVIPTYKEKAIKRLENNLVNNLQTLGIDIEISDINKIQITGDYLIIHVQEEVIRVKTTGDTHNYMFSNITKEQLPVSKRVLNAVETLKTNILSGIYGGYVSKITVTPKDLTIWTSVQIYVYVRPSGSE